MPIQTHLKSRIPEIVVEIPASVGVAIHAGTEAIARDAQTRADAIYHGDDNFNIEAGSNDKGYGIMADWYYFFGEFGTSHQPARPFIFPAAEAGLHALEVEVRAALEKL